MGARVRWSRKALAELAEVRDYIERDSSANAGPVIRQIAADARRLERYPLSGRIIKEWNNPARREVIVGSYRLMYRVMGTQVIVFGVRHTRRRVPKRFRNEWLR